MNNVSAPASNQANKTYLKEAESKNQKNSFHANTKKRILAVDDNASMGIFLYDALAILGHDVVAAGSGIDGFEQFIQNFYYAFRNILFKAN